MKAHSPAVGDDLSKSALSSEGCEGVLLLYVGVACGWLPMRLGRVHTRVLHLWHCRCGAPQRPR